jgi:hypothetical protein
VRFACYTALLVTAVALITGPLDAGAGISRSGQRKLAFLAVLVQLAELALAFALRKLSLGR